MPAPENFPAVLPTQMIWCQLAEVWCAQPPWQWIPGPLLLWRLHVAIAPSIFLLCKVSSVQQILRHKSPFAFIDKVMSLLGVQIALLLTLIFADRQHTTNIVAADAFELGFQKSRFSLHPSLECTFQAGPGTALGWLDTCFCGTAWSLRHSTSPRTVEHIPLACWKEFEDTYKKTGSPSIPGPFVICNTTKLVAIRDIYINRAYTLEFGSLYAAATEKLTCYILSSGLVARTISTAFGHTPGWMPSTRNLEGCIHMIPSALLGQSLSRQKISFEVAFSPSEGAPSSYTIILVGLIKIYIHYIV